MGRFTSNVFTVGLAEVRKLTKLVRFWVLATFLTGLLLFSYGVGCVFGGITSTVSPSFGFNTPYYFLSWVDPTFYLLFQLTLLWLGFDRNSRNVRCRIDEILDSKPISNFEYVLGRTFGLAGVVWILLSVNLFTMQAFAVVLQALDPGVFEPFQLQSFFTLLLIDAPVMLLFWSAVFYLCTTLFKSRLLVLLVALVPLGAWFLVTVSSSYIYVPILSPVSSDSLFLSEIVPEYPSWETLATRIATLSVAVLALVLSAVWVNRQDARVRPFARILAPLSAAVGGVLYFGTVLSITHEAAVLDDWRAAQEQTSTTDIDVEKISGTVNIEPGRRLELDLRISFRVATENTDQLTFILNPSMNIRELRIQDLNLYASSQNGILVINGSRSLQPNRSYVLHLVAEGMPNPRFAYLDNAVDYLSDHQAPRRSVRLLGRDASIFDKNYVALMPGNFWYPVPVRSRVPEEPNGYDRDFFDLDLSVQISRRGWQLVSVGAAEIASESITRFNVTPSCPITEIGVFAANFEKEAIVIDDRPFSLLLHTKHARNLTDFAHLVDVVQSSGEEILNEFTDFGLELPCNELSLVEVPNQLRTVGGGWRMETLTALPGVILLKEHGFPRVRMKREMELFAQRNLIDKQLLPGQLELLYRYFDTGMGTDNLWMNIPDLFWSNTVVATGDHADLLHQVPLVLLSSRSRRPFEFFSIYSTLHVAETTSVNLPWVQHSAWRVSQSENEEERIWGPWLREEEFGERASAWNALESFDNQKPSHNITEQKRLEVLLLKSTAIARGILQTNDASRIFEWLSDIAREFKGRSYSHADLLRVADTHGLVVDPFLTDWIESTKLPGYIPSRATVSQISVPDDDEPSYQISISVHNSEPITGYVKMRYETYHINQGYSESLPVRIDGTSSKRISLISKRKIRNVEIVPIGLSYNRYPFAINLEALFDAVPTVAQLAPPIEADDWTPQQNGVIVDDLDPGFKVFHPPVSFKRSLSFGPFAWLQRARLEVDLDQGLPVTRNRTHYRVSRGIWERFHEEAAFGKYRRTLATVWYRHTVPKARFSAELPEQAAWKLDFHVAIPWKGGSYDKTRFQFEIKSNESVYHAELDAGNWTQGWNFLGEFDLPAGTIDVDLVGTTNRGRGSLSLDAIRWTQVDSSK